MRYFALLCTVLLLTDAATVKAFDTPEAVTGTPVGALRARGDNLADVVDQLRDQTQKNIFVNWRAVEDAGISRKLPVTIDLTGLTLGKAVDKLLKEVSVGTDTALGFDIDEGVLTVSTANDLARNVETLTYDVRQLIGPNDKGRAARLSAVVRRVTGIFPKTWRDNGGDLGNIHEVGGQLIITQTPGAHDRIKQELELAPQGAPPLPKVVENFVNRGAALLDKLAQPQDDATTVPGH